MKYLGVLLASVTLLGCTTQGGKLRFTDEFLKELTKGARRGSQHEMVPVYDKYMNRIGYIQVEGNKTTVYDVKFNRIAEIHSSP